MPHLGLFLLASVFFTAEVSDIVQNKNPQTGILILVALVGLEPTLIAELDFESSASTNSATGPKHKLRLFRQPVLLQLF